MVLELYLNSQKGKNNPPKKGQFKFMVYLSGLSMSPQEGY